MITLCNLTSCIYAFIFFLTEVDYLATLTKYLTTDPLVVIVPLSFTVSSFLFKQYIHIFFLFKKRVVNRTNGSWVID